MNAFEVPDGLSELEDEPPLITDEDPRVSRD
jgi:hypothetical protein